MTEQGENGGRASHCPTHGAGIEDVAHDRRQPVTLLRKSGRITGQRAYVMSGGQRPFEN
jgi:hypothetical protein